MDNHGRPQAVLKLYTFNNKTYTHAWLSLSESTFLGERDGPVFWSPAEPGITWQEIPGAPQPASRGRASAADEESVGEV